MGEAKLGIETREIITLYNELGFFLVTESWFYTVPGWNIICISLKGL